MKKLFIFSMILAATMSFFASCKDDDGYNDADADRLPMPMFRSTQNTASTTTPYYCDIASRVDPGISLYLQQHGYKASTHVNDMRLFWYGVDGADAYELKAKVAGTSWDKAENPNLLDTILTADQLTALLPAAAMMMNRRSLLWKLLLPIFMAHGSWLSGTVNLLLRAHTATSFSTARTRLSRCIRSLTVCMVAISPVRSLSRTIHTRATSSAEAMITVWATGTRVIS